ncbi:hypothetical protein J6590_077270 [Homalodisca vitripennis]|nr:hypothetical protein J6590_077270 [Homalodisca vitripennis]
MIGIQEARKGQTIALAQELWGLGSSLLWSQLGRYCCYSFDLERTQGTSRKLKGKLSFGEVVWMQQQKRCIH